MTFPSIPFLFYFLPVFLLIYGIVRLLPESRTVEKRTRQRRVKTHFLNVIITLGSLYFYCSSLVLALYKAFFAGGTFPPFVAYRDLLILTGYFFVTYLIGIGMDLTKKHYIAAYAKTKYISRSPGRVFFLTVSLILFVLPLVFFKFHGPLPVGISFYTFSSIAYVIDIYRGASAEKNLFDFSAYFLFFPKILQGPITRYNEILPDLKYRKLNFSLMEHGLGYFIFGLALKVLLSNKIGALWSTVWSAGPYGFGSIAVWLGAWGYAMQLYFDFWGYSLMAEGLAMLLGFMLPQNFDSPYASRSFTSFWRRWHRTLGTWFRDYIYIPLGGSKNGLFRMILSLLATWLLTGFWHGVKVNFILWGVVFFLLLLMEKLVFGKYLEKYGVLGHLYVLLILPITWVIFAVSDPMLLIAYLKRLFFLPLVLLDPSGTPLAGYDVTPITGLWMLVKQFWWLFIIGVIFCTPYPFKLYEKFRSTFVVRLLLLVLFWLSVWQIIRGGSNPFMYLSF